MKRTTLLQATFRASVRPSEGGSAIFWLDLQHSSRRTKIDRRPVPRRPRPGYVDRCSPNAAAHETRLPGLHLWNAQFLRPFYRARASISCVIAFEALIILSPLFFHLQRRVGHKH